MSENSRIAKNTVFMYVRMAITMVVGLYTSRVVLRVLGVEDYGLYNVIGGIISLFTVLNAALVNTTSRFITVSLAKGNAHETRQIFNMSFLLHLAVGVIIVVLGETVGLWYLHSKLVIPEGREFAAEWLYQFTIVSAFLATLVVPYNASIVAHERLNVYATIQIIDVFINLGIVVVLQYVSFDKLIFYALLILLLKVFDIVVNILYCYQHFYEVKFLLYWNWKKLQEILSFVGWASVGSFTAMFYSQGINLLLNAFSGPAANAARGLTVHVTSVVRQVAVNIQTAINPQIIKTHSSGEIPRMHTLVCASSRYCYYMLLIIILPVMFETKFILQLWLGSVPDYTVNFIRIILISIIFDAFVNPMYTANLASGKLNIYYLPISINSIVFIFITYLVIKITRIPESVYLCTLVQTIIGVIIRIFVMNKQIHLTPITYIKRAILPTMAVTIIASVIPALLYMYLSISAISSLVIIFVSMISTVFVIYFFGITNKEKELAKQFAKAKLSTFTHHIKI